MSSCFLQTPLNHSLDFSSSSSSSSLCFSIKTAENNKKIKKNGIFMASQHQENPNENNFCKKRAVLFLGFSALPVLVLKTMSIGVVKEAHDVGTQRENQNVEKLRQEEASPYPFLSLLNTLGIIGSGVFVALYALVQKENTAMKATIESMKTKLAENEATVASQVKNFETKLLDEQEEQAKQIKKAKEEQQCLLNKLASAKSTITSLGRELQSQRRQIEELKSHIDRLQIGLTKVGEDKTTVETELKEKLDLIEVLQERINLLSLELKDKESSVQNLNSSLAEKESMCKDLDFICKKIKADLAEANSENKQLKEEVLSTKKELDSKNSVVDDLNARISPLIAERDSTNRRIEVLQGSYNDLKLSSERKSDYDAELLVKREYELHQLEANLGLALDEASNNRASIANLIQERDDLKTNVEIELNNMRNLRRELLFTQESLGSSRLEASDLSKQLQLSRNSGKELTSDLSRVQTEFVEAQELLKRSLDEARLSSEVLFGDLMLINEVLKKTKEEHRVASNEIAAATDTCESLKKELLDIYKKAESAAHDLKEEKKIVTSLSKELEASEKQILVDTKTRRTIETELEEATKLLNELNRNAFILSRDLEMANSRIVDLEDEKDMIYASFIEQKNVAKASRENVEDAHNFVMKLGKERESLVKKAKNLEEDLAYAKGEILRLRSVMNPSRNLVNDRDQKKSVQAKGITSVAVKKNSNRRSDGS